MRYSLLSRFQGVLLGAALAEQLETDLRTGRWAGRSDIDLLDWQPGRLPPSEATSGELSTSAGAMALGYACNLATTANWRMVDGDSNRFPGFGPNSLAEWAIATLPLMLFYHDDRQELCQQLRLAVDESSEVVHGVLALGLAIAQALREKPPRQFIPAVLHGLTSLPATVFPSGPDPKYTTALTRIQFLVHRGAALPTAMAEVQSAGLSGKGFGAIALAFYCFLSSPEHLNLSVLRAARISTVAPGLCALTGALAGAYNSTLGLPLTWALPLSDPAFLLIWGIPISTLYTQTSQLLAAWSGAQDPQTFCPEQVTIAAPDVLRFQA